MGRRWRERGRWRNTWCRIYELCKAIAVDSVVLDVMVMGEREHLACDYCKVWRCTSVAVERG